MTLREFNEAFADELFDEGQEERLYQIENRLADFKGRLLMNPASIPGFKLAVGGVINVISEAKESWYGEAKP